MSPRGVLAVANSKLLQLGRSPIVVVVLAAFGVLVTSLPDAGASSGADRVRQAASWMLAAASALLCVAALLLPVSGGAPSVRHREARLVGRRASNLGHAAAGLAFLVFLAGLLALVSWAVILVRFGNPDGAFEGAVVRRVVWRSADPITLRPGAVWTSLPIAPGPVSGSVQVEIRPRLRFVPTPVPASAPARGPAPAELQISWRVDGGRARSRRAPAATGRPIVETIEVPAGSRSLVLSLESSGGDVEIGVDAGAASVLGPRAGCFAAVARALLVVACAASMLAAVVQWFSNFVSPLIAVAAALTLALLGVVCGALAGWDPLPVDPVAALRRGHETAWAEVGRAFVASAVALAVGSAASTGRRVEGAP